MTIQELIEYYDVNAEQWEALDISKSIALRAGAGSGKTRVLTKRYLRLLSETENIDIENIVAITFTKKAALQMKQRIREEITTQINKEHDNRKRDKWKCIRDNITNSNITTIHGFCEKIIKENFWYLGIEPHFIILEDADRITNLKEIVDSSINRYLSNPDNIGVLEYLNTYGTKRVINNTLQNDIIYVYTKIREKGLNLDKVRDLTTLDNKVGFLKQGQYNEKIIKDLNAIENMCLNIIIDVNKYYEEFKVKENALDFNDLEILSLFVLQDNEILQAYKNKYKYFLVDEFQDVNPIQRNMLYNFVCDDKGDIESQKLFIVGDHKQSIYGFRGTDYSIFNEACNNLYPNVKHLSNCYRSSIEIIDTVNQLFSKLLNPYEHLKAKEEAILENKKVELIKLQREEIIDNNSELWKSVSKILSSDEDCENLSELLEKFQNTLPTNDKKDKYASILVDKINNLLEADFQYKDIAILIRSKTNLSSIENSFRNSNIPYCIIGGIGFWERQEILDIVNLYKFIVNSADSLALIGALRSPLFSFSDNLILEFANILNMNSNENVLNSLEKLLEITDAKEKVEWALKILSKLKRWEGLLSTHELLKNICETTNYSQILLTQTNGYQKIRNLEKLFQISKRFDSKNLYSAREFGTYFDVLREGSAKDGEAVLDTEDSNAVKILTIHASKGLEFDAVIIPDIHSDITKMSKINKSMFVVDDKFGIAVSLVTGEGKDRKEQNPLYSDIFNDKLKSELEDSKRVLYVAMTRAKKFLCLIGQDQEYKDEDNLNSFMKQIKYAIDQTGELKYLEVFEINEYEDKAVKTEYSTDKIYKNINKIQISPQVKSIYDRLSWKYDGVQPEMFSITQYMHYLECPRKYYFRYKAKLDYKMLEITDAVQVDDVIFDFTDFEQKESKISANIRGSIVHKVLEAAVLKEISNNEEIYNLGVIIAKQHLQNEDSGKINEFLIDLKKYLDNYTKIQSEFNNKSSKKYIELPFRIPISNDEKLLVNGVIDRIDQVENELYIIDYKTNVINNESDILHHVNQYKSQLMIYYKAVKTLIKDKSLEGVYLYFLDIGEYRRVEFSEEEVEKFVLELSETFGKISKMDKIEKYECKANDRCKWCEFSGIC